MPSKSSMPCQSSMLIWNLARRSYFYHRARVNVADKCLAAREAITDIFEMKRRCYGYRRLQASLTRQRVTISEKVVRRLMKQESLVVAKPKRRRYGSYLGEISPDRRTSSIATSTLRSRTRSGSPTSRSSRSRLIRCTYRPSSTASMAWSSAGP
jgi:hypothetical protein